MIFLKFGKLILRELKSYPLSPRPLDVECFEPMENIHVDVRVLKMASIIVHKIANFAEKLKKKGVVGVGN